MNIKITRTDGTVIEASGTPEECARLAGLVPAQMAPALVPYTTPTYPWWYVPYGTPQWTYTSSEITVGSPPATTITLGVH